MKLSAESWKSVGIPLRMVLGAAIALIPTALAAQAPQWWNDKGVLLTGTNVVQNDYAAVNQGQVKNIAIKAIAELDADLPGGAGDALHILSTNLNAKTENTNDYAAINIGQLKNLARPFFERLFVVRYFGHPVESGTYPWLSGSANPANDYAMANIGQVKNLFSFNLTSTGTNGLPDWWQQYYFGGTVPNVNLPAPRGDGVTILEAYQRGLNPMDQISCSFTGLTGHWSFNDHTGTTAVDDSGNGNTATIFYSGVTWGNGLDGAGGLVLDGSTYGGSLAINNANNQVIPSGQHAFSISFWFNETQPMPGEMVALMASEKYRVSGFRCGIDDGRYFPPGSGNTVNFWATESGGSVAMRSGPIQSGVWNHFVITYDGTTANMYINGQQASSSTGVINIGTTLLVVGGGIGGYHSYQGGFDELSIYKTALSGSQVQQLYNQCLSVADSNHNGLPDWWELNYFGGPVPDPSVPAPSGVLVNGSVATILEAYQNGLNPIDYYNGSLPSLTIVSGNGQSGSSGSYVSSPLVVKVTGSSGDPLVNAPVTFSVPQGFGLLSSSTSGTLALSASVRTDASANAEIYLQLPNGLSRDSTITCTAGTANQQAHAVFTEHMINSECIIWYVNAIIGSDSYSGLYNSVIAGPDGPKQTIGAALNAASSNETISVCSGTYSETQLNPADKSIHLIPNGVVHITQP